MKKLIIFTLSLLLTFSLTVSATFNDIDKSNEYLKNSVDLISSFGITKGINENEFGVSQNVSREQMSAFLYRFLKKGKSLEGGENTTNFTDLEDSTYFGMISWANTKGIIKGTSLTTFNPKGGITLQDCYTMMVRALRYEEVETISYPYGYIEIAENLELDKGLPASLEYTDYLTRGDVAVILYNAFFAKTGVAETKQIEKLLGEGTPNATYVLQNKTEYPIFCEKYFDVVKAQYQVVATPSFSTDDNKNTSDFGYEAIEFKLDKENSDRTTDIPNSFYWNFENLNLDGAADDYILGNMELYFTVNKDNEIENIYYANCLMNKVEVNDIDFITVSNSTKNSYMISGDVNSAKVLSGEVRFNNIVGYFYNAPYNYVKPNYLNSDSEIQYLQRNEDNIRFITKNVIDADDQTYSFEISDIIQPADLSNNLFPDASATLIETLSQAYFGGLYSATFYDIDGDSRYEYIEYYPYSYAIVDTDDDYSFADDGIKDNVIYVNDAYINKTVKDDDFVIGYFNQEANTIYVAEIVKPIAAKVSDINIAKKTVKINNKTISVVDSWKLFDNYDAFNLFETAKYNIDKVQFNKFASVLNPAIYEAKEAEYYIYDGILVYVDNIKSNASLDNEHIVIITEPKEENWFETGAFNAKTGKREYLAYAWVDGEERYIPVEVDTDITNVFPKVSVESKAVYLDKICNYTVASNGNYTLTPIGGAVDEDGDKLGLSTDVEFVIKDKEDETLQAYGSYSEATFIKDIGKRFKLNDIMVTLTPDTQILIKDYDDEGDYEFRLYNYKTFTDSVIGNIYNVEFVIQEDTTYANRANLVFLYATAIDFDTESKVLGNSDRLILGYDARYDDDYYFDYTVFSPYSGKMEKVSGNKTASKDFDTTLNVGDIAKISNSKIDDKKATTEVLEKYWILDYDEEEDYIEVCKPNDLDNVEKFDVSKAELTYIKNLSYNISENRFYTDGAEGGKSSFATVVNDKTLKCNGNYWKKDKLTKATAEYAEMYIKHDEDLVEYGIVLVYKLTEDQIPVYCDLD